jgi:hypothetical protein
MVPRWCVALAVSCWGLALSGCSGGSGPASTSASPEPTGPERLTLHIGGMTKLLNIT